MARISDASCTIIFLVPAQAFLVKGEMEGETVCVRVIGTYARISINRRLFSVQLCVQKISNSFRDKYVSIFHNQGKYSNIYESYVVASLMFDTTSRKQCNN